MNTVQKKNPDGEKSLRGKFLRGNIPPPPPAFFPNGENRNVNIYLKHTQMCQTDCKSESKLHFRPLKIPAGKNEKLLLLVDITHH